MRVNLSQTDGNGSLSALSPQLGSDRKGPACPQRQDSKAHTWLLQSLQTGSRHPIVTNMIPQAQPAPWTPQK